jgi:hypothetical protein
LFLKSNYSELRYMGFKFKVRYFSSIFKYITLTLTQKLDNFPAKIGRDFCLSPNQASTTNTTPSPRMKSEPYRLLTQFP